jgi:putative acetyltransferase
MIGARSAVGPQRFGFCQIAGSSPLRELRGLSSPLGVYRVFRDGMAVAMPPAMLLQEGIYPIESADLPHVVDVWEASVREPHGLVSEAYLQFFKPLVRDELLRLVDLAGARDGNGMLTGFVATAADKIEALFVHPTCRRRGIGRRLVRHAVNVARASAVDLDEHNTAAVRLFEGAGFAIDRRWDVISLGRTFPMITMRVRSR